MTTLHPSDGPSASATAERGFCPVYRAIGVLQEKWVLHIVRSLLNGEKGFNELARAVGGCNSATLTQRLEHLETLSIINKRTEDTHGKLARSVYTLTAGGRELQGVIDAIDTWGRAHLSEGQPGVVGAQDC
ncbi:winged helix-turn-helix transcriptional regulator [Deinococcus arenicola]|uniref:Helix-turn-helix domain-containing protein n=1 Tax=Deinococcus arenicola TaxID=2994950 RepID=A0ABU4DNB3_9DEIO|nr:helix-turn-helix domain-containing protein [Deinococcus sp. ZS9-10]MDV6373370.1 helix-turn-helix domain-containing protein [Deinococcus sp. ZS9-10]